MCAMSVGVAKPLTHFQMPVSRIHKLLYVLFIGSGLIILSHFVPYNELFGSTMDHEWEALMRYVSTDYTPKRCTARLEEDNFPIAFSMLVYRDFDRALRLLRAIHRPHNCYCIHVDRKTRKKYRDVFEKQVRKSYGPEVFLVPFENTTVVTWGRLSVLESDLLCSRMLLERCPSWLYWINLTGHEFPLRTNWELVTALKLLNGSNAIDATLKSRYSTRLPTSHDLPFQFTWYTGSVHIVARREFVEYIHNNPKAIHLLNVLKHHELTRNVRTITDETFFSTLNHNPDTFPVPGAFLGEHEPNAIKSVARYKVWDWQDKTCGTGYWVRRICMLGLKDLPSLESAPEFFANKFIVSVEPEAYDKLEQWINEKVEYECERNDLHPSFNRTYYSSLELSWNHL
ncbi:N-acetyllactosaminide beta-1,6-N-acetylglucosaminyl-transferase [Clonorchis sinensis]|uniref:N-acetyllactosaminide beta-1,6-N-acetylglucosaminyl-transferase n=1 Tax=Clonorchis sinensis TaxID=79923 RepID=A0A8T1MWG9_CLOSI|nr:N-acetyllactosaminide beta-1,6-N-acetylglucosaminyl-transferase [Clonorchis sinensis]